MTRQRVIIIRAITDIESHDEAEDLGPEVVTAVQEAIPGAVLFVDETREATEDDKAQYEAVKREAPAE